MDERRRYYRVSVEIPITFYVPPQKEEWVGTIVDVSGTGVLFRTQQPVKARQELLLYIPFPAKRTEMHVRVMRVAQESSAQGPIYWVGVRIVDQMKFDEREYVKFYASRLHDLKRKH